MIIGLINGIQSYSLERFHQDRQKEVDQYETETNTEETKQEGAGDLSGAVSGFIVKFSCKKERRLSFTIASNCWNDAGAIFHTRLVDQFGFYAVLAIFQPYYGD
jgi:hypothetical protein